MLRLILKKETQALIYKQVVNNVELLNLLWIEVFTFVFPSVNGQREHTKICYFIIHLKYFSISGWLKAHA